MKFEYLLARYLERRKSFQDWRCSSSFDEFLWEASEPRCSAPPTDECALLPCGKRERMFEVEESN